METRAVLAAFWRGGALSLREAFLTVSRAAPPAAALQAVSPRKYSPCVSASWFRSRRVARSRDWFSNENENETASVVLEEREDASVHSSADFCRFASW
jgi:hypothetical protein